jgi:hypothetical protein
MYTVAFTLPPSVAKIIIMTTSRLEDEEEYKCFLGGGGDKCNIL